MDDVTARKAIELINRKVQKKNLELLTLEEVIKMSKISGDSPKEVYKLLKNNVAYVVRIDGHLIEATVIWILKIKWKNEKW